MSSLSHAAMASIEKAVNFALAKDAPSQRQLSKLAGQQLYLEVEDFNLILQIHVLEEGVLLTLLDSMDGIELDPKLDTMVKGPSSAYRKLLEGDGFFDGDLRIQGNAQALMTLHQVMESFEFDWEAILADKIGDTAAAALARLLRAKWSFAKETSTAARLHLVSYLQSNSGLLPSKVEYDAFVDDLERFNRQLDRAEARLRKLGN